MCKIKSFYRYIIVSIILREESESKLKSDQDIDNTEVLAKNKDNDIKKVIEKDSSIAIDRNALIDDEEYLFVKVVVY